MRAQLVASVLGLLVTSCDSLLTRHKELEYVWKRPLQLTFVRCLFILARYLALLIHIANIVLASLWSIRFPGQQPTEIVCMAWLNFQIASCYSMLLILELILSIRVFALYEQSLKVGIFLSMMLAGRMAGSIYVVWNRVHIQQFKFARHCIPKISLAERPIDNPVVVFIIGEIVVHLVIHGLAWKRTFWDLRPYTFARPPLFSVLNRDSLKVFAAISVAMLSIGVSAGRSGLPVVFVYPFFISLVSSSGCRTILNLQTLDSMTTCEAPSSEQNKELAFTSINDTSTWDTTTMFERDTGSRFEGIS